MTQSLLASAALALVIVSPLSIAHGSRVPDLDPMVESMGARFVELKPVSPDDPMPYFDAPIPRKVHQVWFGSRERMCTERVAHWQAFAQHFGYEYHLWSEDDDALLQSIMPEENFSLLMRLRACGNVHAASDVVRLSLMQQLGGIYCDADMSPPSVDGQLVNLHQVLPMRGAVLLTENFAMNVGNSAMFFANGLMMSSAHHPIFAHLEATLAQNMFTLYPHYRGNDLPLCMIDAVYATGPAFLSRSLAGGFTVLPITYARKLGMVHDGKWDAESGVPFTFDEIGGAQAWQCNP